MSTFLAFVCLGLFITLVAYILLSQKLRKIVAERDAQVVAAGHHVSRIRAESEQALADAQKIIDQQIADLQAESERVREHYEHEALRLTEDAEERLAKALKDVESLSRFAGFQDAEEEARIELSKAIAEAEALRAQAKDLNEQARAAGDIERRVAIEKAKAIYEQADARLNQATRDAGQIVANAETRAEEIAGDAYNALRDKQLLERAAEAMRNVIEGYGDQYIIPSHSLLDDLAAEFGYTAAGESLKSARLQSRRMVEQGEAAACEYVEANRKGTAIRFVVDAFNGRVDAILSRVKSNNYGVLEQEIRDAFSLVNLNGKAFRNAHILPAYLDTRLAELKWAVVVQELARAQIEEQRELKARMRDEEKARREYEKQLRQAAEEEQRQKNALLERERELAAAQEAFSQAAAEDRAALERKIEEMLQANNALRQDLAVATERKLTIAQQTKKGHVYIISNIGAFGDGVYKIGQTRRQNPQDRVNELSDASVPFAFDVHAWIESDNAPVLEHTLQKSFLSRQVNKINSRKEFFRVTLQEVREEVDRLRQGIDFTVKKWTDKAAATEYRESQDIESNAAKLEKWLSRQKTMADREIRLSSIGLSSAQLAEPESAIATAE